MNKYLNYEDNIFILNTRIRMVQDTLALDAAPGIFLEKTVEDCDFINRCSEILFDSLSNNKQLIERDEQLHNLYEMEVRYSNILFSMLHSSVAFSVREFPTIEPSLRVLHENSTKRLATIDGLLKEAPSSSIESRAVSKDELAALLGTD